MAGLGLRHHASGARPFRCPDGRLRLQAEGGWIVEGPTACLDDIAASLGSIATRYGTVLRLDFGTTVGHVPVPHLGTLDLVSGKWTSRDFDAMLRDLTITASRLPFAAGRRGSLPYERTQRVRRVVPYHLFAYLRYAMTPEASSDDALPAALAAILRDPHRKRRHERTVTPIDRARRIDARTLHVMATGRGGWARAPTASEPMPAYTGGRLPLTIDEPRTRFDVDTAENRFVRAFLDNAIEIARSVEQATRQHDNPAFAQRLRDEARDLRRRWTASRRHSLWDRVGPMTHYPASSSVLQRRRGYRQVLRCHARLRLAARVPLDPALTARLLEIRDIAELYELWCFFRVGELIAELIGPPCRALGAGLTVDHWGVRARHDLRIDWPADISLAYNRTFTHASGGSWSVDLRPDITLELPRGRHRGLHLFDAKFKRRTTTTDDRASGTRWQQGDLHKMHAYRDAIPHARSAWVLYPGDASIHLERPIDQGRPTSIGALPARPGTPTDAALVAHLGQLLAHGPSGASRDDASPIV